MPPRKRSTATPAASSEAYRLALLKLETSGLDHDDFRLLKLEAIENSTTCFAHFNPVAGLKIPYLDPWDPTKQLSFLPKWPVFYRLRYLKDHVGFEQAGGGKVTRYVQEPNTGVCAYFPQNATRPWAEVLSDWREPLLITEGELKAAKACREGFATIGLGGVFNFRSTKEGVPFIRELERVVWARRAVYLVFDSDFRNNEHVVQAINMLAEELMDRGALPFYVALPDVYEEEDKKTGLDDFLMANSKADLALLLHQAQPMTMAKGLWALNQQVVYVRDPGMVVVKKTGQKTSPDAFKNHSYSTQTCHEYTFGPDGSPKLTKKSASASWLKWEFREEAIKLTYAPGREMFCQNEHDDRCYNTWKGWGCEPKKGDVKPFLKLVDHLFTGAETELKRHFLRWLAYPLKYPGIKMFSSFVIHGKVHGTGKSLLGATMRKIYGTNFAKINQKDLERDYNDWAENKQFVLGEEITGSNKRSEADALKDLITQTEMRVNGKYVPIYTIPDVINYLYTSNHPDAFFLEDDDRRFNVHEVIVGPMGEEFYIDYMMWLDGEGPGALFDYFMKLDLGDFNPTAPAFKSAAKERMIMDGKSDLGAWVHELLADPDSLLRVGEIKLTKDLYTNKELLDLYDPLGKTKVSAQGMGNNLKKAGARQILDGKPIRVGDVQDRFYAVRNVGRWAEATAAEVKAHLAPTAGGKAGKKGKY